MSKLNADILKRVAECLPPNPIVYTNLAAVNRTFYQVFTSDALWRDLDVYGVKKEIFRHFVSKTTKPKDRAYVKVMWSEAELGDCFDHIYKMNNLYAWYNYVHTGADLLYPEDWRYLFSHYREMLYLIARSTYIDSPAMRRLRMTDKKFAIAQYEFDPELFKNGAPPKHKQDRELIKELLLKKPAIYLYLPDELKNDKEILDLALKAPLYTGACLADPARGIILKSRSLAVRFFRLYPLELENCPQFQDDVEIARAVVESSYTASGYEPLGIEYVSERLRDNEEFIEYALKYSGLNYSYASRRIRNLNNRQLLIKAKKNIYEGDGLSTLEELSMEHDTIKFVSLDDLDALYAE